MLPQQLARLARRLKEFIPHKPPDDNPAIDPDLITLRRIQWKQDQQLLSALESTRFMKPISRVTRAPNQVRRTG